jgi:hypothetical protein
MHETEVAHISHPQADRYYFPAFMPPSQARALPGTIDNKPVNVNMK